MQTENMTAVIFGNFVISVYLNINAVGAGIAQSM
jgi:hypothetical protein